jgi:hypothetical protein
LSDAGRAASPRQPYLRAKKNRWATLTYPLARKNHPIAEATSPLRTLRLIRYERYPPNRTPPLKFS